MMQVRLNTVWSATVPLLCLVAVLLTPRLAFAAPPTPEPTEPLSLCAPGQNTFTTDITNPYFPLPVGMVWVYTGKEQGENIGLQITVLDATETFHFGRDKVITRVVEEREWEDTNDNNMFDPDDNLIEVSLNYYAQTEEGTVCYFGEDVDIFNEDGTVTHEGAWRADDRGNAPGIFMPATPEVGMTFQQEVAPDVAEDLATITRTGTTTLPNGSVVRTITVRDFNPLDGSRGTKVYAQGFGLIQDGPLRLFPV